MKNSLALLFVLLTGMVAHAQYSDSALARYAARHRTEKIFIHFDRSAYIPGETIWHKSYLLSDLFPTDISRNFYTDWYDEDGNLLKHGVAPLIGGSAVGQFEIPAGYKGSVITVKAYTQWMLNFDSAFLFTRQIPVYQQGKTPAKQAPQLRVDFLPEGGDLLEGVETRVAFKATDQSGTPLAVWGRIVDETQKEVAGFRSAHDGMGIVLLAPQPGKKYTALVNGAGKTLQVPLPPAKSKGAVIAMNSMGRNLIYTVKKTAGPDFSKLYVVATINGNLIYRSRINLTGSDETTGSIPMAEMPAGVVCLSLFTDSWVLLSERICFNKNNLPLLDPQVDISENLNPRGKNQVYIHLPDTTLTNLSVAVTDADLYHDSSYNMVSHLLLSSELKGRIYRPSYYLPDVDTINAQLDLVMLTNGWRRIDWEQVLQNRPRTFWFAPDSAYMQFGGKIFGVTPNQLRDAGSLNLIFKTKDSLTQFIQVAIQPDGSFRDPSLFFYDTVRAYYQFNNKKQIAGSASVKFQNGFRNELYKKLLNEPFIHVDMNMNEVNRLRQLAQEKRLLDKLLEGSTLEAVTVTARKKSAIQELDEKYTSGLFQTDNGYSFDFVNDPVAQTAFDVFSYLTGRVPGLQVQGRGSDAQLTWRGASPQLFLNEMPVDADVIGNIPPTDIAYVKVIRPPFLGGIGGSPGGAIAVYTRRGGDVKADPGKGMEYQLVAGYSPIRQFYSPDYSDPSTSSGLKDVRSTLYWNPFVVVNKDQKTVSFPFYNNDISKKLRVVITGVNEDGRMMHYEEVVK